jgi:hypothetical protein
MWTSRRSSRIYLDEIDQIIGVMSQIGGKVEVDHPEFAGSIASGEDLKVIGGKRATNLTLKSFAPGDRSITFISGWSTTVRISRADDQQLYGAFVQLKEIVRQGTNFFNWIAISLVPVVGGLVNVLLLGQRPFVTVAVAMSSIAVLTLVVRERLLFTSRGRAAIDHHIVLDYRADAPTWWQRNRSAVLIGLALNVVTSAAFFALGQATDGNGSECPTCVTTTVTAPLIVKAKPDGVIAVEAPTSTTTTIG